MWRASVGALAALVLLSVPSVPRASSPAGPVAEAVEAIGLTVSDLDRGVAFFRDVLTFEVTDLWEQSGRSTELLTGVFGARTRTARLRLGAQFVELTEFLAPRERPFPADTRANDQWFQHIAIVVSDTDAAYRRLRDHRVAHASTGPQRLPDWNPDAGGIQAFYFRDPDGHPLELIHFPGGKGDPRWHRPTTRLFLGIDHTAIAVDDTGQSLRFYRDRLGLRVAGASLNHGPEQERLSGVQGARVRITTLRAPRGMGIELLEYLAPPGGRRRPELRAHDLLAWQTTLLRPADGLDAASVLASDPDGHVLRFVTREPEEEAR